MTTASIVVLFNTVDNDTDKGSSSSTTSATEGAFVPLSDESDDIDDNEEDDDDDDVLDKVEMFGKGAAKVCSTMCWNAIRYFKLSHFLT